MNDIRAEDITHPRHFPLSDYHRVLVIAPHPDDEVFGCGGLIAAAVKGQAMVTALVLTDVDSSTQAGSLAATRRSESLKAAAILGHTVEFAGLIDRPLRLDEQLISTLRESMDRLCPDLVLCPSLSDPHPDHQAVALAVMRLVGVYPHLSDLAFYEVNGGLTAVTHLLELTGQYTLKAAAMAAFASQEADQPYASRITARDHFRAFFLGLQAEAAEAFFLASIRQDGFLAVLPGLDPLFRHIQLNAAALPDDAPLVSVIVRTIGDVRLEAAIASVLAQSYRPVEIVVVAAHGQEMTFDAGHSIQPPLVRYITPNVPLNRPAAANAGLDGAYGHYAMFLDDDDLLLPDHIEKLVSALIAHPECRAANTGVRVQDDQGRTLKDYTQAVDQRRMLGANVVPIHAVLFDLRLVRDCGCRFDESLPKREDWDFWLQVLNHTPFIQVPGITAIYRYADRSELQSVDLDSGAMDPLRQKVMSKWRERLDPTCFSDSLGWFAMALDHSENVIAFERTKRQTEIGALEEIVHSERCRANQADERLAEYQLLREAEHQLLREAELELLRRTTWCWRIQHFMKRLLRRLRR
jgi:LmbE family N-acetylglucosaminyl deacetylase/glycosyltransferase involved in cell wall biosynthesis